MQAGHYQPAGYVGTNNKLSFDEYNIHCQCVRCNEFGEGRQEEMGLYIERKYGKEKRDELRSRAHKVDPVEDWEDIIEYYAKKLKLI